MMCNGTSGVTEDGNGRAVTYSPLSSTSYGEPDGLFGINCGHVQYLFIPGVNIQRYFPKDPEQNAERYKQFQKQRAMERDIRATKRECMMLQAAGDDEGLQKASQRLRRQKEKYGQFCTDTGLGSHLDRTQVYGYDRSKSSKTVWAERKVNSTNGSGNNNSSVPSAAGTPFQTTIPNVKVNNSPTNQIVKEKFPVGNGKQELYRGYGQNGLTNPSTMLYNIVESTKLTADERNSFKETFLSGFNMLPEHHKDIIKEIINNHDILVEKSGVPSGFDWETKQFRFNFNAPVSDYVHEFAHAIYDYYRLYENKKFISVLTDGIDLNDWTKVKQKAVIDIYKNQYKYYIYSSEKFVNEYQGRLYFDTNLFNTQQAYSIGSDEPLNPLLFQEYFSVGYETYFFDKELLKSKDIKLFNLIEGMIANGGEIKNNNS